MCVCVCALVHREMCEKPAELSCLVMLVVLSRAGTFLLSCFYGQETSVVSLIALASRFFPGVPCFPCSPCFPYLPCFHGFMPHLHSHGFLRCQLRKQAAEDECRLAWQAVFWPNGSISMKRLRANVTCCWNVVASHEMSPHRSNKQATKQN